MKMSRVGLVVAAVLACAACGSVDSSGTNDVPTGPAIASANGATACGATNGTGVDATVIPSLNGSVPVQGYISNPPGGQDTGLPTCLQEAIQNGLEVWLPTPGATLLSQTSFTIKDGVVQVPGVSGITIIAQWFEWDEPTPGTCSAEVDAVVSVSVSDNPTCAAILQFGTAVAAPLYTYSVPSS